MRGRLLDILGGQAEVMDTRMLGTGRLAAVATGKQLDEQVIGYAQIGDPGATILLREAQEFFKAKLAVASERSRSFTRSAICPMPEKAAI